MSQDYFLRAADEQSLYAALESAGLVDAERSPVGVALDVIGPITQNTGTEDAPVIVLIPGFHANLRGELTDEQAALLPIIPEPTNPVRVWA